MRTAASVKDVAAAAGVSLGTVSNVLNRPSLVSATTRLRVEQTMAELGFVRNESARSLRAGRSSTLAYVMLDATNPFFTDVARGIEDVADGADLSLFLCDSISRADREAIHLRRLEEQRVQGVMITPLDPDSESIAGLRSRGTSVVVVDRRSRSDKFCSVAVDDVLGGRLAIEHLIDRGHVRVGLIGGPMSFGQVVDRWRGAHEAWDNAGMDPDDLTEFPLSALSVSEGRLAGQRLLGLPASRRPTAAFCANDLVALGLLQQVVSSRMSVPEDLAIVGYDDIEFAAAAAVPLTSVSQPRFDLGRTAAELLLDETNNPDHEHQQVEFVPELVARASTVG